jgi:hypothetical protein
VHQIRVKSVRKIRVKSVQKIRVTSVQNKIIQDPACLDLKTVVWVINCLDEVFQNYSNRILLLLQHKKRNSL